MPDGSPLYGQGAFGIFIVTASDGHLFRCSVELVGKERPERRWIFEDATTRYVGPPYYPIDDLDELAAIVSEWWESKKALGQAGVSAEGMRNRLAKEIRRDASNN